MRTDPLVSGVVLAAGTSQRFGTTKQLADIAGRPLVWLAADQACRARLAEVIVVVGHEAAAVAAALGDLPVRVVLNEAFGNGQSTSVRTGLASVAAGAAGAMFIPADQPGLTADILDWLVAGFERHPEAIVVPVYAGRRGSPVTFPRALFPDLASLEGDHGGRVLLDRHHDRLVSVHFASTAPLVDIDTVGDWEGWAR